MQTLEITLFIVAVVGVIALGIWKSKDGQEAEQTTSGYFLAGRGLTWWLVGFSLIAANISTEQFVGMSGSSANWLGMAIASYEWLAGVTLVVVGFVFLPRFLKTGVYTIPEFLELRFGVTARLVMAISMIAVLVVVTTAAVIFSGAKFVSNYYNDVALLSNLTVVGWMIAILAAVYVFVGGLKACAWTDLIWGTSLILGGAIVMWFTFGALADAPAEELFKTKVENSTATVEDIEKAGAIERLYLLNDGKDGEAVAVTGINGSGGKMHMVRPNDDSDIPWSALMLGLWIPNFYYWGLNQYIVQRTLGSKSLAEGQKGIVFAAFLKLIIPFIVVIPGILAFNLFSDDLHETAAVNNIQAIETAGAKEVYTVDAHFVELQPELAQKAMAQNAQLADTEIPVTADHHEFADAANGLGEAAIAAGSATSGPKLVGYDYDSAFPVLVRNLIKEHWYLSWFVLAALFGAVISSLASMLNSASTIATMDLYQKFTGEKDPQKLVKVGKTFVVIFVLIAAIVAPNFENPKLGGVFNIIQKFQGFISPGILCVFLFGFLSPRTPRSFGVIGIVTNAILYGVLIFAFPDMPFLNQMSICLITVAVIGIVLTLVKPLAEPVVLPVSDAIPLETSKGAKMCGIAVICMTLTLYVIFW
ncbi:MAG: sodium/solute symporter [Akkermansiaceae bacterium]